MPKRKQKPIAEVSEGTPEEAVELLKAIEEAERWRLTTWRIVEAKRAALKEAAKDYEEASATLFRACQVRMEKLPLFKGEAEVAEVEVEAE